MAKIMIPTPLRQFVGGADTLEVGGDTVGAVLGTLTQELHPALRNNIYTPDGKLRSFVNVYVNDEDIRYMEKDATPVKDTDVISIVPSIAGGVR